ncbi:MAG: FAD-dependent oxidoreductase [Betaproteobacteria bacterium]
MKSSQPLRTADQKIVLKKPLHCIAVLGAGIAGLSCATELQQAGAKVTMFEKSGGAAGRMSTRRGEDWQCDHGAQYFTARDPDFLAELKRWQQAGVAELWTPRISVVRGESPRDNAERLAADMQQIDRFVGVPRMTAPGHWLADRLQIMTETTVKQLQRRADGWHLFFAEHAWLDEYFDAVLLALPAPQAITLLGPLAPELSEVARGSTMRGSWAMILRFAAQVALPFDAAFVNAEPLRWIARDSSKPRRQGLETWLLHASAEWSEAHIEENGTRVAQELLDAFRQLGGPEPAAWTAHRWRYADTEPALSKVFAWDAEQELGLCGDWLNGGKVEGAWLSGSALARQVIENFRA